MLGVGGYYRGSTVLMSGTAGMGKSTFAAALSRSACERGERVFTSRSKNRSNRSSVTCDRSVSTFSRISIVDDCGSSHSVRFYYGLEMHLVSMHKEIRSIPAGRGDCGSDFKLDLRRH